MEEAEESGWRESGVEGMEVGVRRVEEEEEEEGCRGTRLGVREEEVVLGREGGRIGICRLGGRVWEEGVLELRKES